ncbi:MAG: LysR family transcriptional regulator [Pseudomonadota bacterium]
MQNSTIDWDDVRLFLELTRGGSARAAAAALGISHSTIVRRVERLENRLGTRLFDRDFSGYRPTAAGETLLTSALAAEDALLAADRQLQGADASLSGEIRLTTGDVLIEHLLMPDIVAFSERYPDIELTVLLSYDLFDLARREADIALRSLQDGRRPPDDLVGRKLVTARSCYYATEEYLAKHDPWSKDTTARWVGWEEPELYPEWVRRSPFPHVPAPGNYHSAILQIAGVKAGLGMVTLPCFAGDRVPGVMRIPGCEPFDNFDLWMLWHPDLRDAARHRRFREYLLEALGRERASLLGEAT